MKKTITLFLALVSLFAATHTTLAFHYCGGNLRSVGIAGLEATSCCGKKHGELPGNENSVQHSPCCSNHYLGIGTDDFPTIQQHIPIGIHKDFHPAPCLPYSLGWDNLFSTDTLQYTFPPPGDFTKSGSDILIFIRILRI